MGVLVNLWTQVRRTLNLVNGGTGNTQGWSTGVVKDCWNRTGSTLALNTLVKLTGTYNDPRVTPCNATTDKVLGVVVGYWDPDDPNTLIQADAPDVTRVAVLTHGTARVLVTGTATRGQYAFPSTTAGAASSSATIAAGAFGVFQGSATTGNTAIVTLTGSQGVGIGSSTTFGTPAIVLGTAAAAGSIAEAIRRDATIVAFDATTPAALTLGGSGAVGAAAVAARRDHGHAVTGALDALSDVTAPTPATGDVLAWSGSAWVNESPGATANIWRPVMAFSNPDHGEWTPGLAFVTPGTSSFTPGVWVDGQWARVGNMVFATWTVDYVMTIGTGAGELLVTDLPFPVRVPDGTFYNPYGAGQLEPWTIAGVNNMLPYGEDGADYLYYYWTGTGGASGWVVATDLADGHIYAYGTIAYETEDGLTGGQGGYDVLVDSGTGEAIMAFGPA